MRAAKHLYREMRFNVKLPAEKFASDPERKEGLHLAKILVQGVIDCIIEDENGNLHLVDYKTDRLTKEERQTGELGDARMREKHSLQLSYYKSAIEIMFGKAPEKIGVYSLHLGREVEIRDSDIKG
jgi:ATP-dependent helicase/nuclease subunit A